MMNIPMTKFEIYDQSAIAAIIEDTATVPLFLTAFASPKGPEDMRVVQGSEFYNLYGSDISFQKYGQPLLQAAAIIDAGGKLLVKRAVADDAKLANLAIIANVKTISVQKKDSSGALLYTDIVTGIETIESVTGGVANAPVMINKCEIKFTSVTVTGEIDRDTIANIIENTYDGTNFVYPLFTIMDNGRGSSIKKFRISPDYNASKYLSYMKYTFDIMENDSIIESLSFSLNPNTIDSNLNQSIQSVIKASSKQLDCVHFENYIDEFVSKVSEISGNSIDYCIGNDILFGTEKKLNTMTNIVVNLSDSDSINLSYVYGLELKSGDNGSFGISPLLKPEYSTKLVEFFDGTFTTDIYDLDNYKIDLVLDANYPAEVKRAIETLVNFREDCLYIRDMGIGLRNISDILAANTVNSKDRYSKTFHVSYDIIDPYTKKQIPVTICYSLAKLLVTHFINGRTRPLAGQLHDMIITDAIKGTINFIPKITPSYNEKEQLVDARINYVGYYDGVLTIETLYTSQEGLTQLSFSNNVLAIQEIIKAVRTRCPKIRYSFMDGDDLQKYKEDVQTVLDKYSNNFVSLRMTYTQDETMIKNKVFNATIEVEFRDFVETEYFKLYTLN